MISNYTTLQSEVDSWLARTDLSVPSLIQLAELRIGRLVRRKTLRASLTLSAYANVLTQLADFGELRSIRLDTAVISDNQPIKIVSPEQLAEARQQFSPTGRPRFACVVGTELLVGPSPDQDYSCEVTYFEKLTPLSDSVPTNSILTEAPDIYLWGTLVEGSKFLEHDARVPMWKDSFDTAINELNNVREREEFSASLRPIRLPIVIG